MSRRRVHAAVTVLAATFAAAVWLVTYRVWDVIQYIEYIGGKPHYFHPSERVRVQPWWSVPATVAVLLAGSSISLWLLPGSRGLIKRSLIISPGSQNEIGTGALAAQLDRPRAEIGRASCRERV